VYNTEGERHKVLTCVEYRAVSGVFQNIDPRPPSLHSASVSSPRTKGGGRGGTHSPGGEGVGGQYLEDARHWIGLLQYNPSAGKGMGGRRRAGIWGRRGYVREGKYCTDIQTA
jgi:hypothetical protein